MAKTLSVTCHANETIRHVPYNHFSPTTIMQKASLTRNRTAVTRVTGGYTNHYTIRDRHAMCRCNGVYIGCALASTAPHCTRTVCEKYCRMRMVAFVETWWFAEMVVKHCSVLQAQSQNNRGTCSTVWLQDGCMFRTRRVDIGTTAGT